MKQARRGRSNLATGFLFWNGVYGVKRKGWVDTRERSRRRRHALPFYIKTYTVERRERQEEENEKRYTRIPRVLAGDSFFSLYILPLSLSLSLLAVNAEKGVCFTGCGSEFTSALLSSLQLSDCISLLSKRPFQGLSLHSAVYTYVKGGEEKKKSLIKNDIWNGAEEKSHLADG